MRNRLEEIGLISQSTLPARRGHEARNQRQRADVDQKPLETRPHHVSGARRVAAPVPRTGEQAHGLKTTSHPHAACGGKSPHTACEDRKAQRRQQVATCSAWKTKRKGRCSFQPDVDDKRSGTTGFPRAETAPVAMGAERHQTEPRRVPSRANTALGHCHEKAHATRGHHADYAVDGSARSLMTRPRRSLQSSMTRRLRDQQSSPS